MKCFLLATFASSVLSWQPSYSPAFPATSLSSRANTFSLKAALLPPVDASSGAVTATLVKAAEPSRQLEASTFVRGTSFRGSKSDALSRGIHEWLLPSANAVDLTTSDGATGTTVSFTTLSLSDNSGSSNAPTEAEVELLQKAFATFYGTERDLGKAADLFAEAIVAWERQPPDEKAGLYRVRGDCLMELTRPVDAAQDYGVAIKYLEGPGGEKADPEERPAARLGRGRAIRSLGIKASKEQAKQASEDYQQYFRTVSGIDFDSDAEAIADGISRNPYAAWEWGMIRRVTGEYKEAAETHQSAARAFDDIGDHSRAVISTLDAGIDLAASDDTAGAINILRPAIDSTPTAAGRDVALLQRVVAKEGEAGTALAGIMWDSKDRLAAEKEFGVRCGRLDELTEDYQRREKAKEGKVDPPKKQRGGFSIDDIVGAEEASCSRFKNDKFIEEKLVWPPTLQKKVNKFLNLER